MTAKKKEEPVVHEEVYDIGLLCDLKLTIPAGTSFELSAVNSDGVVELIGRYNPSVPTIERLRIGGYHQLIVRGETPSISIANRQTHEPYDHNPPPVKDPPKNIMQKIRQKVKNEMGSQRESFLQNDTPFQGYEIPDEEPDIHTDEKLDSIFAGQPNGDPPTTDKHVAEVTPNATDPDSSSSNSSSVRDSVSEPESNVSA